MRRAAIASFRPRSILLATGLPLVALFVALGRVGPLRERVDVFVPLYTAAFVAMLTAWLLLRRTPLGRVELVLVFVVAAAMRLAVVDAPLSLSGDVWRYLWDGDLTLHHGTPYGPPPIDDVHAERRAAWGSDFGRINSPHYHTVYPPLAQAAFAGTVAVAGRDPTAWRALALALDLVSCGLMLWLLRRLRAPPALLLLYAWSPFVALELVGVGHSEVLVTPLLLGAALAAFSSRPIRFGVLAALAVQAKFTALVPATILLAALVHRRRREDGVRAVGSALAATFAGGVVLALTTWPFLTREAVETVAESLRLYAGIFEFNAGAFYGLRGLFRGIGHPVADATLVRMLAAVVLVAAALAAFVRPPRDGRAWADRTALVAGLFVVLGSSIHPWYLMLAYPFVALRPRASWLYLAWALCWSYGFYTPQDTLRESIPMLTAVWAAFGVIFLVEHAWALRRGRA